MTPFVKQNTYYVGAYESGPNSIGDRTVISNSTFKNSDESLIDLTNGENLIPIHIDHATGKQRGSHLFHGGNNDSSGQKPKPNNEQVPKSMLIKLERALIKQQVEQSRQLTELNKAKHQAMVAKAHKQVGQPITSHVQSRTSSRDQRDHRSRHKTTHTSSTVTVTTVGSVSSSNNSLPDHNQLSSNQVASGSVRKANGESSGLKGRVPTPYHPKAPNSAPPSKPQLTQTTTVTDVYPLSRHQSAHTSGHMNHVSSMKVASTVKPSLPTQHNPSPYTISSSGLHDRNYRSWSMSLK